VTTRNALIEPSPRLEVLEPNEPAPGYADRNGLRFTGTDQLGPLREKFDSGLIGGIKFDRRDDACKDQLFDGHPGFGTLEFGSRDRRYVPAEPGSSG